jgi:hypothetical protein
MLHPAATNETNTKPKINQFRRIPHNLSIPTSTALIISQNRPVDRQYLAII